MPILGDLLRGKAGRPEEDGDRPFTAHRMPTVLVEQLAAKTNEDVLGFDQIAGVLDEDMQRFFNYLFEITHAGFGENDVPPAFHGVLISGPAGVGKTTLARALAKEAGAAAVLVDNEKLAEDSGIDSHDGAGLLKQIAALADSTENADITLHKAHPRKVIAILDEADRFIYNPDGSINNKKSADLKVAWDQIRTRKNLFVVLITNHPERISDEIRSRLEKVEFGLPKTEGQLADIVSHYIAWYAATEGEKVFDEELLDQVHAHNDAHEEMMQYWKDHPKAEMGSDKKLKTKSDEYVAELKKLLKMLQPVLSVAKGMTQRDMMIALHELAQRRHVNMVQSKMRESVGAKPNDRPIGIPDIKAKFSDVKAIEYRITHRRENGGIS